MGDQVATKCQTLVVDDSPTILATAKKMLENEFVVHTAKDGAEAWELINNNKEISVVFSDMQMPVMNGMQLLLKVRESDDVRISRLPMIMITGQSDSPAGKRAVFEIGATDFIGKPFDAVDLLSRARSNTRPLRRSGDSVTDESQDTFITPSGFQSIGNEILARAFETKEEFSVITIELVNLDQIKKTIDNKSVRQIIVSLVKRISGVLRERDVATRIGENKFVILLFSGDHNTRQAVDRLCEYMKKLVFELNGKTLRTDLAYGYASANCYDKNTSFNDICQQSDSALKRACAIKIGNKIASFDESGSDISEAPGNESIDIWPSLTHIVDGNYHLVDEKHFDEIIKCMNNFIKYAEGRK